MKFLLDHDVYAVTAVFLRRLGHDVLVASQAQLARATDSQLLEAAHAQQRVLVTRDRDFGRLVFVGSQRAGVLYLRVSSLALDAVHAELQRVLESYSEEQLRNAFVAVEPGRHRLRKLAR